MDKEVVYNKLKFKNKEDIVKFEKRLKNHVIVIENVTCVDIKTGEEFLFDILCFVPYIIENERKIFIDAINCDQNGDERDSRIFSLIKDDSGEYVLVEDVIKYVEEFELTIIDQYYRYLSGIA